MEEIIPKQFKSNEDLHKFTTNLEYTKESNDLSSLTKVISFHFFFFFFEEEEEVRKKKNIYIYIYEYLLNS